LCKRGDYSVKQSSCCHTCSESDCVWLGHEVEWSPTFCWSVGGLFNFRLVGYWNTAGRNSSAA